MLKEIKEKDSVKGTGREEEIGGRDGLKKGIKGKYERI